MPLADLTLVCALLTSPTGAMDDDAHWAQWRGPNGSGFVADCHPPTEWSETKNIRWKTRIPGKGYASPVVYGDRIYLMTAVEGERASEDAGAAAPPPQRGGRGAGRGFHSTAPQARQEFQVLAVDRNSGEIVWSTTVRHELPHEGTHGTSTFASPSVVTDGDHVFAHFGSRGLYCLDTDGAVVWEKDLGDMRTRNQFGEGASPALYGDILVVPWDHEGDSFVVALDKNSGSELWRQARDEPTTWATPAIVDVGGRVQAILPGTNNCISYDLKTGEEIWRCDGLTVNAIPTPIVAHGMVYLMSGFRGNVLRAVKLDAAEGDIDDSDAIVWTHDRGTSYVPSAMLSGERLYFLRSNNAIISCVNALTGQAHYIGQRLDVVRNVYASIIGAGGHVYICGREGNTAVLEDGTEFRQIRTNTLGEGINATPAIVGDVIYLRGDQHLYCIAEDTATE